MKIELVPYWRSAWRFISVRCVVALGLWNMIPYVLADMIPRPLNIAVSALLLLGTIYGTVVNQKGLADVG